MNTIKHICIFTQSPLVAAPRVVKEANVYSKAGYRVTVFALWYDADLLEKDRKLLHPDIRYKAGVNLLNYGSLSSKYIRLKRKLGRAMVQYLGIQSRAALGYSFYKYLSKLLVQRADLYIGHEEMSMALSRQLLKRRKRVAFDFEDWHSKDLLPADRKSRPIALLKDLENHLLRKASYTYTTSRVLAEAMRQSYGVKAPYVIYNSFYASDRQNIDGLRKDRTDQSLPSLYWFSQVISKGRGLELLVQALQLTVTPMQLHLRGRITKDYKEQLNKAMPKHITFVLHAIVPSGELISRIAEHDVGIAFEERTPESRDYTITNKVFHYLQSGIAILATHTKGQAEVKTMAGLAVTLVEHQPHQIAKAIEALVSDQKALRQAKDASWQAGGDLFNFKLEELKLLQFVKQNH